MDQPVFLSEDDIATLTGRKTKQRQIEALRSMGVPFYVNAIGRPVVARSTIEGRQESITGDTKPAAWRSNVLNLPTSGVHRGKKADRQHEPATRHARAAQGGR